MKIKIKHRFTNNVLFACDADNMKNAVFQAIKSGADLSRANLYGADLSGADLSGADLSHAYLSRANLYGADLSHAYLSRANLYGADLSRANLYGADLSHADLSRANLYGADLSGADLTEIKNSELSLAQGKITPESGAFVGYKKLKNGVIAQLIIPHDAERTNCFCSRKCRASKAFVNEMYGANEAYDQHTGELLYKVGEWVIPDSYDPSITVECSHGIHFFLTRIEAENY